MSQQRYFVVFSISIGLLMGCASANSKKGFGDIDRLVNDRTQMQVHWNQGTETDRSVAEKINALLKSPLSDDAAVQIALLNNPSLQATFEDLGVAQADLVQAGLLQNPIFSGSVRFARDGNQATQFSVSENLLDLIALPLRHRAAKSQFSAMKLQVTDEVLGLEAEVRSAFYRVQGAQQMLGMRKQVLDATQISTELSERQHKAGNLSALDWTNQQSAYHQAAIEFSRNEAELYADREHLARLLNVLPDTNTWKITDALANLPANDPALDDVQKQALAHRLDLAAAREEVAALGRTMSVTRFENSTSGVNIGVETEKDAEGQRTTGPVFNLPIPLFDRNQASVAKATAEWRKSKYRLAALEADVKSQVRLAHAQLGVSRHIVEYSQQNVLPLQEETVRLSQQFYNFMLLGVYQLIIARQNEIIAHRVYIDALRDYWIAHAALEKVVGGRFELAKTSMAGPAQSPAPAAGSTKEDN